MLKFRCDNCNKKIGVSEDYTGKLVKCPKCGKGVRVPDFYKEPVREEPSNENIWPDGLLESSSSNVAECPQGYTLLSCFLPYIPTVGMPT